MKHVACCHFIYVEGFISDAHEIGRQAHINLSLKLPGVEVWEQQLGKGIVVMLLPDLRPGKRNSEYHFHFSEGGNKSTDFHDLIGKANASKFLSVEMGPIICST